MARKFEPGFVEASSDNLPVVDSDMIDVYYRTNTDFLSAEVSNIKMSRATKEVYGDAAVGFVQLKRDNSMCTVKARVTPEHKVREKGYTVTVIIDEDKQQVISSTCHDCAASAGGCKHGVALLFWLHRRTEEPSVTSVTCYWRASKLSKVGSSISHFKITEMCKNRITTLPKKTGVFLNETIKHLEELPNCESLLLQYFKEPDKIYNVSLHNLVLNFKTVNTGQSAEDFINFCKGSINLDDCKNVEAQTVQQSKSSLWYHLRYGRITASKLHEASRCTTIEGSLTETILGATKVPQTKAMARGLKLEDSVLKVVESKYNIKCKKVGLLLNNNFPIFGASPDAISEKYCIEIKCPSTDKTILDYVDKDGCVTKKPYAQLQLQMLFAKKQEGLLCVASPNFEKNAVVSIYPVKYNKKYCKDTVTAARTFWIKAIFPLLMKN